MYRVRTQKASRPDRLARYAANRADNASKRSPHPTEDAHAGHSGNQVCSGLHSSTERREYSTRQPVRWQAVTQLALQLLPIQAPASALVAQHLVIYMSHACTARPARLRAAGCRPALQTAAACTSGCSQQCIFCCAQHARSHAIPHRREADCMSTTAAQCLAQRAPCVGRTAWCSIELQSGAHTWATLDRQRNSKSPTACSFCCAANGSPATRATPLSQSSPDAGPSASRSRPELTTNLKELAKSSGDLEGPPRVCDGEKVHQEKFFITVFFIQWALLELPTWSQVPVEAPGGISCKLSIRRLAITCDIIKIHSAGHPAGGCWTSGPRHVSVQHAVKATLPFSQVADRLTSAVTGPPTW